MLVAAAPGAPVLRLHRPGAFCHRVGENGLIGFGESYQDGDWDSPDLVALLSEPTVRLWRLYLAGSSLAFGERRMGVDQFLAVRPPGLSRQRLAGL